ncbi:hypothetical protein E1301_Tti021541 [Triplophysa tibetana]|uniref:Uncharacterized protein n=1 Tax=Triplophysa tibetana TaxID=1572043 RepID=A0A5A9PC77_9TELE|nr:hypothetical protein E1301_Tti021541 [Triplophysa tibetana]
MSTVLPTTHPSRRDPFDIGSGSCAPTGGTPVAEVEGETSTPVYLQPIAHSTRLCSANRPHTMARYEVVHIRQLSPFSTRQCVPLSRQAGTKAEPTFPPGTPATDGKSMAIQTLIVSQRGVKRKDTTPPIDPPTADISLNGNGPSSARSLPDPRHTESSSFTADAPDPFNTFGMLSSPLRHLSVGDVPDLTHSDSASVTPVAMPTSHIPSRSMGQISATPRAVEHSFRPRFRLGKTGAGSIPCSAALQHILTLLEHLKEQQMQLAVSVNNLNARLGKGTPVAEMPHDVNVPLATMPEVEEFEQWLQDSRNAPAKQNRVFSKATS